MPNSRTEKEKNSVECVIKSATTAITSLAQHQREHKIKMFISPVENASHPYTIHLQTHTYCARALGRAYLAQSFSMQKKQRQRRILSRIELIK